MDNTRDNGVEFAFKPLLFFCFACIILAIINIPNHDTLYYWDWSRRLALSYYDGPPLVAYILRGYVCLFGHSELALNLLAIFSNLTIAASIFLLANTLFNFRVAYLSMLIWMLSPIVFIQYGNSFSYDTPFTLFWVLTLHFFYQGTKNKNGFYLYLAGISGGLMMLSKYIGVLLFVSLIILCVMSKAYRSLFKNPHLYFSGLLSFLIFSPVLYWNLQNSYSSFHYQLNHGFDHLINFKGPIEYLGLLLICYNIILILFIYCLKQKKDLFFDKKLTILLYPALVTLLFFLPISLFIVKYNWQQTFYPEVVIIIAYAAIQLNLVMKIVKKSLTIYAIVLLVMVCGEFINNKFIFSNALVDTGSATKMAVLPLNGFLNKSEPVFISNFRLGASLAYFLHGQPFIYSIDAKGNQYNYWSKTIIEEIKHGRIQQAFFVDTHPLHNEMHHLFASCKEIYKSHSKTKFSQLYLYQCTTSFNPSL